MKFDGQQCSSDENIGSALPPPKKVVPAIISVKRIQYGGSEGKPTASKKSVNDTANFADTLLRIIKPRESEFNQQQSKKGKRKCETEEEANPFARPKKRPHNKSVEFVVESKEK